MYSLFYFINYTCCFFLLIAIGPISSSIEEDDDVEKSVIDNLKPASDNTDESDEIITNVKSVEVPMDESDQSSEEKERIEQALEVIQKPKEQDSDSNEQDDDDRSDFVSAVNNDHGKILLDSDEGDEE